MMNRMSKRDRIEWLEACDKRRVEAIGELAGKVSTLENIIKKAGLIEDVDLSDVIYVKRHMEDGWGGYEAKVPVIVNQVKVK